MRTGAGGEQLFTVEELAARWKVNTKTVYAAVQCGHITAFGSGAPSALRARW